MNGYVLLSIALLYLCLGVTSARLKICAHCNIHYEAIYNLPV
jgi:hypothetical protein